MGETSEIIRMVYGAIHDTMYLLPHEIDRITIMSAINRSNVKQCKKIASCLCNIPTTSCLGKILLNHVLFLEHALNRYEGDNIPFLAQFPDDQLSSYPHQT